VACSQTRRSVGAVLRRASAAAYSTVGTDDGADADGSTTMVQRRPCCSSPSRRARAREPSFDEVFFIDDL